MPMIWAMGDSHAAHLQGLLYALHNTLGVGVHLISTPGRSFPFRNKNRIFEPRLQIYAETSEDFKAGDIVLISRLYLSRTIPPVANNLKYWLKAVEALADELAAKGVHLLVTGPPPMFPFDSIRTCKLEERDVCRVERAVLEPVIKQVMDQLLAIEASKENVIVFDTFEAVCPATAKYCFPDNGSTYLFRNKDHFNALGSG